MLITTEDQLAAFAARAAASDVLAIDTEFLREKTFYPRLCLLQLGTDDEQVAVDPFAVDGVSIIRELLCDPAITKVLHACSQDMELLLAHYGVLPRPVFDTQIAAEYLGKRSQIGYAALVEDYCGTCLPKTESLTDWSQRPLDDKQLEYAYDDVRYLPRIWRLMRRELADRGRLEWLEPEFAHICDPATYKHEPREAYQRLRHLGSLTRRQLSVAREVAAWREDYAMKHDRPRRWVLSDEVVVEIARRSPTSLAQLERIRGVSALTCTCQTDILIAVRRGLAVEPDAYPPAEQGHLCPTPDQECVCDLMYALTRQVAQREGLAQTVLATRDDLLAYLAHPQHSPLSSGWRAQILGNQLDDLLQGRLGLTVKDGRVEVV